LQILKKQPSQKAHYFLDGRPHVGRACCNADGTTARRLGRPSLLYHYNRPGPGVKGKAQNIDRILVIRLFVVVSFPADHYIPLEHGDRRDVPFLEIFGLYEGFVEHGSQYPERDQSLLLACSFYTRHISASITCYPTPLVYVIEFSAY